MGKKLLCGAARELITPPEDMLNHLSGLMNSSFGGVVDDLYVRVIALKYGDKKMLLVSFDLDKAACPQENLEALEKETGIPKESVLFIGIHTHSAPVTGYRPHEGPNFIARKPQIVKETTRRYEKFIQERLLKAAHRALYEMRPAQLGFAYGESYVNVNRVAFYQVMDQTGSLHTEVSTGTNYKRPADPTLFVMKFQEMDGKPIAFFINYACHNTVMILNACGKDGKVGISADMGGNVSKEMERFYEGSVAMWSSGAAGDINPVMSNQVYREEFRTGKPVEMYEKNGAIPLSMLHTLVAHLFADVKNTVRKINNYSDECELSSAIRWAKTPGLDENGEYKVFVHKLRIGKIILMGFGGELYSVLGKEIQENVGVEHLILINHDASLLYNSGYIYSDEVFELAEKYESNIVGMNHTWMKPGYILEALVKNMQEMF